MRRIHGLDGPRAVAILSVLASHFVWTSTRFTNLLNLRWSGEFVVETPRDSDPPTEGKALPSGSSKPIAPLLLGNGNHLNRKAPGALGRWLPF